jgi:cAMP-dependent protein kinase regulator
MPEENDNEASEGDNNSFKNVLGKWSTRASISDSEGNVAYVARLASMGKARSQTTTGNPQEDHMAPQGIPKSPMHVSPRASPRQFRKGQGGLMNRISRFEREQDSNGSSSQTSLVVDFPVGAVPLYTTKNNLGSSNGDLSKDESSSSVEQKEPQVDSAQSSIDDHSTSESSSSKKKEPIIVSPKYSKKKLMDSSDHSESSSERKFSTPNNGTKNKIKSYSEHSKGESLEGTDISPRLPPSPFGSRINSPKKSPKNNTPKKSPKRMSNGDKIISPNGQKVQQLHMLFGQPLTQAAAAASSSPGGKGSLPRDDRQYNSPCVTGSPVGMLHPETPKSWREKMGGGILSPPLTSSVPNTPTESSESEDYFQVSRSPSGFMKGRQRQGLGMLSPRLLQKKKPSYQTWKEKVAAALDDDDDDDLPSQDVDHRRRRNSALDEDESTPNDDDDDLGEMSLNDEIEPQGDGTIRSSLGVKGLAGRFNKKPKEEKPKDEVPKVYVRHTKELASKLEADRQVDNATSGEDGGTLLKDDSSPSRPTKVPSRLGSVNNLADRFHKKLAEMEKPMTESPRNRQGNVKDLVSKIKEEQEIEKQEEAEKRKEEKPADQPADKPDVRDSVGALAKKWEIKRVEDNPRSVGPAKSRRPQEQGLNKEVAREFIRQESARQLIEPVIEPVKETVKETDKGQKPIRRSMKKPSEDGECSGKKEEGEADPDNRRARLKATKSELHDLRRKLQATKSGIARKTEEVRAPLIATTGEFEPPVFVKEHFEEQLIRKALKRNFVFGDLDDDALATFIGAFEGIEVHKREKIMNQGDKGDYFYVIARGKVSFGINGVLVGTASEGTSFGELALLYTCPRAATVMASAEPTKLFRVDQKTFRHIMESKAKQMEELQLSLLRGVSFLKDLVESDLKRLSSVMFPRIFDTGEVITKKGDVGDAFYILYEGSVKVTDISIGNTSYEDVTLESGDHFGEMSLITSAVRAANVITLSKGTVFSIDRETFEKILGKFSRVILKAQDRQKLVSGVGNSSVVCLEKVL